jgi:hypothetical protein
MLPLHGHRVGLLLKKLCSKVYMQLIRRDTLYNFQENMLDYWGKLINYPCLGKVKVLSSWFPWVMKRNKSLVFSQSTSGGSICGRCGHLLRVLYWYGSFFIIDFLHGAYCRRRTSQGLDDVNYVDIILNPTSISSMNVDFLFKYWEM